MVRSAASVGWLLAVATVVALALAAPADAGNPAGWGHTKEGSTHNQQSSSGKGSSSGGAVQKTAKSCSLYATSSSFGLSCVTPGGSGQAKTVAKILAGDAASFCWDTKISDADLASKYEYAPTPDAPAYLESCITGLNPATSLYYQPNVQLNQQVIEIPAGAQPCPVIKPAPKPKPGAKVKPAKVPVVPVVAPGPCVKTLTTNQAAIVAGTAGKDGQIPGITITTQPSTRVRTNEAVAFVDAATDANGDRITRTPNYTVGGVTLWAVMNSFTIHPFGPDQAPSIPCDGTAQVTSTDTPETMPNACWWTYKTSSGGQPGLTYPFRAEADWTVYYSDGAGTHQLASFNKYDDLKLPVNDIQTRVIN